MAIRARAPYGRPGTLRRRLACAPSLQRPMALAQRGSPAGPPPSAPETRLRSLARRQEPRRAPTAARPRGVLTVAAVRRGAQYAWKVAVPMLLCTIFCFAALFLPIDAEGDPASGIFSGQIDLDRVTSSFVTANSNCL